MTTEKIQAFKKYLVLERNYTELGATGMAYAVETFFLFCQLEEIKTIEIDASEKE